MALEICRNFRMISLPRDRMDQVVNRFDMLEAQMAAGVDPDAYVKMASEYAELQEMAGRIRALRKAEQDRAGVEALLSDPATDREMRDVRARPRTACCCECEIGSVHGAIALPCHACAACGGERRGDECATQGGGECHGDEHDRE